MERLLKRAEELGLNGEGEGKRWVVYKLGLEGLGLMLRGRARLEGMPEDGRVVRVWGSGEGQCRVLVESSVFGEVGLGDAVPVVRGVLGGVPKEGERLKRQVEGWDRAELEGEGEGTLLYGAFEQTRIPARRG